MLDCDPQTRTYCKTASQLLNDRPIDSGNVRFGSVAALQANLSSMSASGGKPASQRASCAGRNLNGFYSRNRSFVRLENH